MTIQTLKAGPFMRAVIRIFLVGSVIALAACPAAGDERISPLEMGNAARAFLKAYHAKDVDGMMAVSDAPFGIGGLRNPKVYQTNADLKNALQMRLNAGTPMATKVMHPLKWD